MCRPTVSHETSLRVCSGPVDTRRIEGAFVDELRGRVRLSELAGERVALKRRGRFLFGLCPFHAEKTPNFMVDDQRRRWRCWGCGAHGDAIDFVMHAEGLTFAETVEILAARVGLDGAYSQRPERKDKGHAALQKCRAHPLAAREALDGTSAKAFPQVANRTAENADGRRRSEIALAIWRQARPNVGTPAEAYLGGRGITADLPPSLRFLPALTHRPSGRVFPALVAAVSDARSKITAVWQVWIARDAAGAWRKAPVEPPRMGLGRTRGGAVRLSPLVDGRIAVTEGIETGLAVASACPGLTIWAALSTAGMAALEIPPGVAEIILYADHDVAGIKAAHHAAARFWAEGRRVRIARPLRPGTDANDRLVEGAA